MAAWLSAMLRRTPQLQTAASGTARILAALDAARVRNAPRLRQCRDLALLMRLDRPVGSLLLLWPTLWALWIASAGWPGAAMLAIFVAGTVIMRSAGCVANDLADRNLDPFVKRTRLRPLAARRVSPYSALWLMLILGLMALVLVLLLDPLCFKLALIGAALTITYPYTKRFLPVPQLYLGLAFSWGVPMAFAAVIHGVPRAGWLLLVAGVLWAGIYDTFYAIADRDDDRKLGNHSSAIAFGDLDLVVIGGLQLLMLIALVLVGRSLDFGKGYYLALGTGLSLFVLQQAFARQRDAVGALRAFGNNAWFGAVVFAGIVSQYPAR